MRGIWEENLHSDTGFGWIFFILVNGSVGHSFNRPQKQKAAHGGDSSSPFPSKKQMKPESAGVLLAEVAFGSVCSTEVPLTDT